MVNLIVPGIRPLFLFVASLWRFRFVFREVQDICWIVVLLTADHVLRVLLSFHSLGVAHENRVIRRFRQFESVPILVVSSCIYWWRRCSTILCRMLWQLHVMSRFQRSNSLSLEPVAEHRCTYQYNSDQCDRDANNGFVWNILCIWQLVDSQELVDTFPVVFSWVERARQRSLP